MPQGSTTFHESEARLKPSTRDMHRAIASLIEGLEAVDWHQQPVDATENEELRGILRDSGDEAKEHAAMVLEWIRRHDAGWDRQLRDYLFREGSIVAREGAVEQGNGDGEKVNGTSSTGASIGSLRARR